MYRALSSRKFLDCFDEFGKLIKFSPLPKNGVDQCDGQDDINGQLNFFKIFGPDLAEGIDFSANRFSFSRMRKCVMTDSRLQVISEPRAPDIFQLNLTRYLGRMEKRVIIVSSYKKDEVLFGGQISTIFNSKNLMYLRFEILTENSKFTTENIKFYIGKDVGERPYDINDFTVPSSGGDDVLRSCKRALSKSILIEDPTISKIRDIEEVMYNSFFWF